MPGPPPKAVRRRRNAPASGEWKPTQATGWQHGKVPAAPADLRPSSAAVWQSWFKGWWASHWTPDYLPQIRKTIQLYDATENGDFRAVTELRQWMDGIGVTFKGQQMLHWSPPKADEKPAAVDAPEPTSRYAHLRAV